MRRLCFPFLWILLALLVDGQLAQAQSLSTPNRRPLVSVSGVAVKSDNAAWREGLVGFGLRGLVAQALYDSNRLDVVEDNPALLRLVQGALTRDGSSDILITGQVQTFNTAGQSRRRNLVAPPRPMPSGADGFSAPLIGTGVAVTTIRVDLSAVQSNTLLAQVSGQGEAKWKKVIVLKDQGLPFEPSLVAPALRNAVQDAVSQLVTRLTRPSSNGPTTTFPSPISSHSASLFTLGGTPRLSENSGETIPIAMAPLTLDPSVGEAYPVLRQRRVAMGLQSVLELAVREDKSCTLLESDPEALSAAAEQWEVGQGILGAPPQPTTPLPATSGDQTIPNGTDSRPASPIVSSVADTTNAAEVPSDATVQPFSTPALGVPPKSTPHPRWLIAAEVFSFCRSVSEKNSNFKGQNVISVGIQLRAINPDASTLSCRLGSAVYEVAGNWKGWNWKDDGADINWKQDLVGQAVQGATTRAWQALQSQLMQSNSAE